MHQNGCVLDSSDLRSPYSINGILGFHGHAQNGAMPLSVRMALPGTVPIPSSTPSHRQNHHGQFSMKMAEVASAANYNPPASPNPSITHNPGFVKYAQHIKENDVSSTPLGMLVPHQQRPRHFLYQQGKSQINFHPNLF